jgi:hypothetical protein
MLEPPKKPRPVKTRAGGFVQTPMNADKRKSSHGLSYRRSSSFSATGMSVGQSSELEDLRKAAQSDSCVASISRVDFRSSGVQRLSRNPVEAACQRCRIVQFVTGEFRSLSRAEGYPTVKSNGRDAAQALLLAALALLPTCLGFCLAPSSCSFEIAEVSETTDETD